MSYQPKTYREQGGDNFVVASGGTVTVQSGGDVNLESGGDVNVASGGAVKLAAGGHVTLPVAIASTAATAAFGGILQVSSTGSGGTGVYKLAAPTAAGQTMYVYCKTSTGVVTLQCTGAAISAVGDVGNLLTFKVTGSGIHLFAVSTSVIHGIHGSTTHVTCT